MNTLFLYSRLTTHRTLAVPIVQAIISNSLLAYLPKLTEEIDPRYILSLGAINYNTMPELSGEMRAIVISAMARSIADAFRFALLGACVAVCASFVFGGRYAAQPVLLLGRPQRN